MADNEKIGLEAVFESEDFQQGIADYNSAISDSVGITSDGAGAMQDSFAGLSSAIDQMASDTSASLSDFSQGVTDADGEISSSTTSMEDSFQSISGAVSETSSAVDGEAGNIEASMQEAADSVDGSSGDIDESMTTVSDSASETASNTKQSTDSMADDFDAVSSAGKVAFGALAAAIALVTAELLLSADAASESQDVMAELEFQVNKSGDATGITKDQVLEMADAMSQVVPIDDEVITQAITMGMRFDNVNKDNIQPLLSAAADLSVSTGKTLPAAMKELALAFADPEKAARLLKDANITLTDAQTAQLKKWKETGNTTAYQSFLMEQLNGKIGGLAETMGGTASGKIKIMQTALGNMQEELGGGFLDAISEGATAVTKFASDPQVHADLKLLGQLLGQVASAVVSGAISMATVLSQNQGIIVGVLAAITFALLALAAAAVVVFFATAEISIPLLAIGAVIAVWAAAIGAAVAFVATAWIQNWGDIQGKTAAVWSFLQPIFGAIAAVLQAVVGIAISSLMMQWNALVTVMKIVAAWVNANIMPLFNAVANLIRAVVAFQLRELGLAFTAMMQAGQAVEGWINQNLLPVFNAIGEVVDNVLMPILEPLANFLLGPLAAAFGGIGAAVQLLIDLINNLANALDGLAIPPNLTPGSPTPFEMGLRGINQQLDELAGAALPAVRHEMEIMGSVRELNSASGSGSVSNVTNTNQSTRTYIFGPKINSTNRNNGVLNLLNGLST